MTDQQSTGGREDARFPESSYGGEGKGSYAPSGAGAVQEGSLGGRQDARFPESSYASGGKGQGEAQGGGSGEGREDGRVPDSSYGGEGEGSYAPRESATAVHEGRLGGRQDGRFPESSYDEGWKSEGIGGARGSGGEIESTDGFTSPGGRHDGRFPDSSYGGEGQGSYAPSGAGAVEEGSLGGRQDDMATGYAEQQETTNPVAESQEYQK